MFGVSGASKRILEPRKGSVIPGVSVAQRSPGHIPEGCVWPTVHQPVIRVISLITGVFSCPAL